MSLAVDVWPALTTSLAALVNVPPTIAMAGAMPRIALKGLSEGEQLSVPQTPWAWLMNSTGAMKKEIGSDQSVTVWMFNLRLFAEWEVDPTQAERILMPIIEQVRLVFQQHLKLGTATIVFSMVRETSWGYTPVNGIWYRSAEIGIEVSEKELRNFQA